MANSNQSQKTISSSMNCSILAHRTNYKSEVRSKRHQGVTQVNWLTARLPAEARIKEMPSRIETCYTIGGRSVKTDLW